jgi:hypothetical protein
MQNFGHGSSIFFDATFGTNQSRVHLFCYCMKCHIINMFHNIGINVGSMFFAIPFIHLSGVPWMAKWDINCIHYHWKKSREWPWPSSQFEHYQSIWWAVKCLMLSMSIIFKLKSMCWSLISYNLPTTPCLFLYYSAYFVTSEKLVANHILLHNILWCITYLATNYLHSTKH